jgi:SAM-dependent methyltransferase
MKSEQTPPRNVAYSARVRYDETNSEVYQSRNPKRHRAEMKLIARAFNEIPYGSVLDIPSGGGRAGLFLAQQGYQVTCADHSQAMVDITRRIAVEAGMNVGVDQQDIESMTYGDGTFDTVLCFRLFHHFPDRAIRERAVREMCRVARERVAISYFSPFTFSALRRKVRGWVRGRQSKFATSLGEVSGYFEACGFRLEHDFGQIPLVQTLHLGVFRRVPGADV